MAALLCSHFPLYSYHLNHHHLDTEVLGMSSLLINLCMESHVNRGKHGMLALRLSRQYTLTVRKRSNELY
jgi:hypothetical protein